MKSASKRASADAVPPGTAQIDERLNPTPERSTLRHRASISFSRQERDEIRHGFQQHIFVDRYCAAAAFP
jgi:hypothetical protein